MNLNILGHEFKFTKNDYDEDGHIERYICEKCNTDIDKFKDNTIFMWIKGDAYKLGDYVSLLSCEECIIKSIIE